MDNRLTDICWDVAPDTSLEEIGGWCLRHRLVNRLLVVARTDRNDRAELADPRVEQAVTENFGKWELRTCWASTWPGTQLVGDGIAKVWIIAFDSNVCERMISLENRLCGWTHAEKHLPEDICLYRYGDPFPTFVTVTHGPEAWLLDGSPTDAKFAERALIGLPEELIPAHPDFVEERMPR